MLQFCSVRSEMLCTYSYMQSLGRVLLSSIPRGSGKIRLILMSTWLSSVINGVGSLQELDILDCQSKWNSIVICVISF